MGLESVTHISDLVATNPVGATDPKSQGDDHIRNIKSALLTDFPNITGAVTADQTELNYLDGATGVTGTGNTVRSASPTFTGTLTAATVAATTITGAGSGLTSLNASNLASGTVPDARFPSTLPALNGSALTNLAAANITGSHALPDSVLSTNVPLLNAANTFTANQTISKAAPAKWTITDGTATMLLDVDGFGFVGTSSAHTLYLATGNSAALAIDSSKNFNFYSGTVTTDNASASEVGFKGIPFTGAGFKTDNYTAVLADAGNVLAMNASGKTFTIPANASVAFPVGTVLTFFTTSTGSVSIAITSDELRLAGTSTTGTRTLAGNGIATAMKVTSTIWVISGAGLS
jgi:hypothetical protein